MGSIWCSCVCVCVLKWFCLTCSYRDFEQNAHKKPHPPVCLLPQEKKIKPCISSVTIENPWIGMINGLVIVLCDYSGYWGVWDLGWMLKVIPSRRVISESPMGEKMCQCPASETRFKNTIKTRTQPRCCPMVDFGHHFHCNGFIWTPAMPYPLRCSLN